MKCLKKLQSGVGLSLVEEKIPPVLDDEVLVKVQAMGICGTDKIIYNWGEWAQKNVTLPVTVGHEFSGEVVEVGKSVKGLNVGDNITADSHIYCGTCTVCQNNNTHVCESLRILGVNYTGAFAEYITIPAKIAWKNNTGLLHGVSVIKEPFGNAVHALLAGEQNTAGKSVLIYGGGTLGIMAIIAARFLNAGKIIVIEKEIKKHDLLRQLGADHAFSHNNEVVNKVLDTTNGHGVDIAIDYVVLSETVNTSLKALKNGGSLSISGLGRNSIMVDDMTDIVMKGKRIFGISGRKIFETWEVVERIVSAKRELIHSLITSFSSLDLYNEAFLYSINNNPFKVVIYNNAV